MKTKLTLGTKVKIKTMFEWIIRSSEYKHINNTVGPLIIVVDNDKIRVDVILLRNNFNVRNKIVRLFCKNGLLVYGFFTRS